MQVAQVDNFKRMLDYKAQEKKITKESADMYLR